MFTPRDNTPPETTTTVDPDASPAERSSTRRCYSLPSSWRQSEGRFSLGLNIPPSLRRRQPTRSSSFLLGRRPSRESQSSREGSSQQSEPSPPLSPFRSVSGMKKPFPLMLSEPGSPSTSDLSAHKTLPAQNIFPISQSATLPPATSTQTSHQMEDSSLLIGTEPCAIKGSDSQNESGSSESTIATDDFNCPCSAPGSPCEELCILSDYGVSDEATPSPEEDDQVWFESLSRCSTLQIGLSDLLNPNLEKACVPGVAETLETHGCHPRKPASLEPSPMEKPMKLKSALNDEAQWLGGSLEMTSWLDDVEGSDCDGDYPMKQSALFSASSRDESSISLTPLIQDGMDESISYATTLTPRKPIVVHVRRSSASLDASSITKSSSLRSGNSGLQTPKISTKRAHNDATWTPPDTPEHVEKLKLAAQQQENKSASSDSSYTANEKPERTAKKAAVGDFATPPHSPDIIHLPSSSSSASTLTPSEIELRIASLLEDSVRGFPATMLQLDSPVIELIRDKHILSTPSLSVLAGRSRRPSNTSSLPPSLPLFMNNSQQGCPSSKEDCHHLAPLRSIFPETSDFLRSAFYVHLLALNHISALPFTPSSSSPTSSSSSAIPTTSPFRREPPSSFPNSVSPKAQLRLGISSLGSNSDPQNTNDHDNGKSTFSSASTTEMGAGALGGRLAQDGEVGVGARFSRLETGLKVCAGRLMEAMCGRGGSRRSDSGRGAEGVGTDDEMLMVAVREVVRLLG